MMAQNAVDMRAKSFQGRITSLKKRTIVIEFLDRYHVKPNNLMSFVKQHGGVVSIIALGNVRSPYIWHMTTCTQRAADEIVENPPIEIDGRDVLVYRLSDSIYTAQLQWIPFYVQSKDIREAVEQYIKDFQIRRLRHTEDDLYFIYDTTYTIFSPENLNKLPGFLDIQSDDSVITAHVEIPDTPKYGAYLYENRPALTKKMTRVTEEMNEEIWKSDIYEGSDIEHFV